MPPHRTGRVLVPSTDYNCHDKAPEAPPPSVAYRLHCGGILAPFQQRKSVESKGMPGGDDAVLNHTRTVRLPHAELARQLVQHLGPTLVAVLAGVRDRKLPHKWATEGGPTPRPEALQRLQVAHRAWVAVAGSEGDDVARAWFIGANPHLDEVPPYEAIRDGEFRRVMAAAAAFVDGTEN